jgi:hypothetical protein
MEFSKDITWGPSPKDGRRTLMKLAFLVLRVGLKVPHS